ncbi:uncharacterized protein LOC136091513 isoform X1 [Hydra vulgaris]|uniref:Uncharacterized protein LOC136091513 isoform X1 n=1 Tax=Hydra vulgaris TaxID=6087 RepID=A0ABM4DL30_HYDVU
MLYAIVAFGEENTTDYLPLIWLVNAISQNILSIISSRKSTDFYWPRWTNVKKIDFAKSMCQEPEVGWLRFSGRILSTADTESEAKEKCRYAEDTSNVDEIYQKNLNSQSFEENQGNPSEKKNEDTSRLFNEEFDEQIEKRKKKTAKENTKVKKFDNLNKSMNHTITKPVAPSFLTSQCCSTSDDVDLRISSSLPNLSVNFHETNQRNANASSILSLTELNVAESSGIFKAIFKGLEQIKDTQKIHSKMIQHILLNLNIEGGTDSPELPEGLQFPATTIEELDKAQEILTDVNAQKILVRILVENGRHDISEFIKRNMTYLIGNTLARQLNMTGQKNKRGFIKTLLYKVLFASVKKNISTRECTKKQLEEVLSKWFGNSRDRGEGRRRRLEIGNNTDENLINF